MILSLDNGQAPAPHADERPAKSTRIIRYRRRIAIAGETIPRIRRHAMLWLINTLARELDRYWLPIAIISLLNAALMFRRGDEAGCEMRRARAYSIAEAATPALRRI